MDAEALFDQAQALTRQGADDQALETYARLLSREPGHAGALERLGLFYREREDLARAISCYERLIAAHPDSEAACMGLGQCYLQAGRAQEAQSWYAKARSLRRVSPEWPLRTWRQKTDHPGFGECLDKKINHDLAWLDYMKSEPAAWPPGLSAAGLEQSRRRYLDLQARIRQQLAKDSLTLELSRELDDLLSEHAWRWNPGLPEHLLNPLQGPELEATYFNSRPRCLIVDNLLTAEILARLQAFCLRANIWQEYLHGQSYLCAYPYHGINFPIFYQLAARLQQALPGILAGHQLKKFWLYKYASDRHQGVNLHADSGAVNVNIWLFPEQGNLDAGSGGLTVYDAEIPIFATDEEFHAFHRSRGTYQLLEQKQPQALEVPYRMNRMVLFDANLLHQSMPYSFRPEYEFRRVNLTLMFGRRGRAG